MRKQAHSFTLSGSTAEMLEAYALKSGGLSKSFCVDKILKDFLLKGVGEIKDKPDVLAGPYTDTEEDKKAELEFLGKTKKTKKMTKADIAFEKSINDTMNE